MKEEKTECELSSDEERIAQLTAFLRVHAKEGQDFAWMLKEMYFMLCRIEALIKSLSLKGEW